ncbi:glycoside hydrolase family protein [Paenarthrobacter nitroguajacolicus]|uniref:glycosyl hydrolase family 32 n=1 Tax=Paenarthrobacter nitroguajacolicus TaxID=211146 RepID=UPI000A7ED464|nr:glycosyl hydrolase family 32 [Paenarthrobacter nitroguajacolicus]
MALSPVDRWIWDFWHVEHENTHHLYYLQAPKSLGDPELRHRNATIGHATSTDLSNWTEHGAVLTPGAPGSVDATATWTGSIVRGDDGTWFMFYTGSTFLSADTTTNMEVIAMAASTDLHTWTKDPSFALHADPNWYETLGDSDWPEEAWRDPWVYRDDAGLWHMLITARSNTGPSIDRGVVGHATSPDLLTWTVQPPLTEPRHGFAHLEVFQRLTISGQPIIVFSAHDQVISDERRSTGATTGTWVAPWHEEIELDHATNLSGASLYSGRIVDHSGSPVLLAFELTDGTQPFVGGICDPIPVALNHGRLTLPNEARTQ